MPDTQKPIGNGRNAMRHLFVVRHGYYIDGEHERLLSRFGIQQITSLSELIRAKGSPDFHVVSSPEGAAFQSAKIIAEKLGVSDIEKSPELTSGCYNIEGENINGNPERVQKLVDERKGRASSLILVSHFEVGENFPSHFLRTTLKVNDWLPVLGKGEAVHFDLEQKTYDVLRT